VLADRNFVINTCINGMRIKNKCVFFSIDFDWLLILETCLFTHPHYSN
jgi:hypothetical protein